MNNHIMASNVCVSVPYLRDKLKFSIPKGKTSTPASKMLPFKHHNPLSTKILPLAIGSSALASDTKIPVSPT